MNVAAKAYETTGRNFAHGRIAEALAFSKAARALEEAKTNAQDREKMRTALRFNNMIWTAVQAEVADKNTTLPRHLKAGLMSLSLFVDRAHMDAMVNFDPSQIQTLIDINREMASGLMTTDNNI